MTKTQLIIKYCAIALALMIIVGIFSSIMSIAVFLDLIDKEDTIGDMESRDIEGVFTALDIEIDGASLQIVKGDSFKVESNYERLKIYEGDTRLSLKSDDGFFDFKQRDARVVLTVPVGTVFDKVEIETGAGKLYIEELKAKKLSLELGAGSVDIKELYAYDSAEINGGAGELTVSGGELNDLSLDMGVGRTHITSKLTGESEIDHGVGEAMISLVGAKEDYKITVDKGLGNASVDGVAVGDGTVYGNGSAVLDINGGVGSLKVEFVRSNDNTEN